MRAPRLRRRFGDSYLAAGKSGGRFPIERIDQLTDRERKKIEAASHRTEVIAVLDESCPIFGHYALDGPYALDTGEAFDDTGEMVLETALCVAYPVVFFVERGRWSEPRPWLEGKGWEPGKPLPLCHLQAG